jgi:choline dehydrogenase-like flavoprotein
VILAAGAPFTPTLLRRAGLRARALGRGLRIHPAVVAVGVFDEEIRGWRGVLQSYLIDALADEGIMAEATFPPPSLAYAETGTARTGRERKAMLERLPNMAVLGALVSDTSSGRVFDRGPGRTPLMTYRLNAGDRRRTMRALRLCADVLFAAGATEVHPMVGGAPALRSPAQAESVLSRDPAASRLRLTAYHPMGTARLGADPAAVLRSDGTVRGIDRLAVVDASVFPGSLGVNPQVTIMAFASMAADRLLARW